MGAFFVLAGWVGQAQAFCPAPTGLGTVQVRQVIDGDTVRLLDGRSVRLIGINAPEIGRKGRSDQPFAMAARRRLQALVDDSDGVVSLQPGREAKDRYDRTLAHLYGRNGASFEAQLLAEGLAFHVAIAPNTDLAGCQHQAEQAARAAGTGVWRKSPVSSAAQIGEAGFALMAGRVSKIDRGRSGVWVELDDSVVLHFSPKVLGAFSDDWFDGLAGRQLEARGWVIDRSRRGNVSKGQLQWMVTITDPTMVQVDR